MSTAGWSVGEQCRVSVGRALPGECGGEHCGCGGEHGRVSVG